MRYSRELIVGLTLLTTLAVVLLGIRFFQGIPLFSGSYELYTILETADGITPGSSVRLRGVAVGSVGDVRLDPVTGLVRVALKMDSGVQIHPGAMAAISGLSALGSVTLSISPGDLSVPPLEPGSLVPPAPTTDLLGMLTDQAPVLVARTDSVLLTANQAAAEVSALLGDPNSDLRLALAGLRQTTMALNALIRAQSATLDRTLRNSEALTADLSDFTATNSDSLTLAVSQLNNVLRRVNSNLSTIESSTETLDELLARVSDSEGTLGLLLNDSTLYVRLDTTLTRVNGVVDDFQRHPGRYLKHIKLVDIF